MKRWQNLLQYIQFPLKLLFIAIVLLGIGTTMLNPNMGAIYRIESEYYFMIANLLRFTGAILIQIFPLLVFVKMLSRRYESSVPLFVGLVSIFVLNISMIFFLDSSYPTHFYRDFLGIKIDFTSLDLSSNLIVSPFNVGIISLFIIYFLIKYTYKKSRHHTIHGILSFIDHDTWFLLTAITCAILSGIGIAIAWPVVIMGLNGFMEMIASDITNPLFVFIYTIFERVAALFDLIDIPRSVFWFGDFGGSWMDLAGSKFVGDVAIWTAQSKMDLLNLSGGRFITIYYVINMFIIPSFLVAYYTLVSNKKDRKRYLPFIILAIIVSFFCGNSLPYEVLMVILCPLLYIFYLFLISVIAAIFTALNFNLGYFFEGPLMVANPGSGIDFIAYMRNPNLFSSLLMIVFMGIIAAIIFYIVIRKYFNKYALSLIELDTYKKYVSNTVMALGGIDNIIKVDSTPDKLVCHLNDKTLVDFDALQEIGAYLVVDARKGYLIRLERGSIMIYNEITKMLKEKNDGTDI